MIDEINVALEAYYPKWHALVAARKDEKAKTFFEGLMPTAVGWKVADRVEYDRCCAALHDQADQIIETWMNGRWIAKFHLRGDKLAGDIEIVKIMQRRPDSKDALGLDHVDFYGTDVSWAERILQEESDIKWTNESNDTITGYDWISVWFDGTEAKLKRETVLDIIRAELEQTSNRIKGED